MSRITVVYRDPERPPDVYRDARLRDHLPSVLVVLQRVSAYGPTDNVTRIPWDLIQRVETEE